MRECSNDMPLSGISLTGAKDQEHGNNGHEEVSLDETDPDHGVVLHEAKRPDSNHSADRRASSTP